MAIKMATESIKISIKGNKKDFDSRACTGGKGTMCEDSTLHRKPNKITQTGSIVVQYKQLVVESVL
jgi:hypothetical protein